MASFVLAALDIDGTIYDQLESVTLAPSLAHAIMGSAGSLDPEFITNIDQNPTIRFTTTQIQDILDLTFLDGFALAAGSSVILWFREMVAGGGLTALDSSSHLKVTCYLGLLTIQSVNAGLNTPATAEVLVTLLYDGTNNPFLVEKDVATVPSPTVGEYYVLGKGWIEQVAVARPQGFTLNTGLELDVQKEGGSIWPVQASIISRRPTWQWVTLRTDIMDSTGDDGDVPGLLGKSLDFSGSKATRAFLQSTVKGGSLVAEAGSSHIKFEITEGVAHIEDGDFQPGQTAPVTVTVTPTWDGTVTDIMTYTKDVAINAA